MSYSSVDDIQGILVLIGCMGLQLIQLEATFTLSTAPLQWLQDGYLTNKQYLLTMHIGSI